MRVLYIHQYFCTRNGRSGTRSYEFGRHLVAQGHQVTMLTSDSDLSDVRVPEGRGSARLQIDGIDVVAVRVPYSQHLGVAGRIQSFLKFMVASSVVACRLPQHDVVIATSTPLTVAVPGLLVSALRRIPLVFEVRDLWPEAPIQMQAIRNPWVIRTLRAFERFVYRRSAHVIALSPGMRDGVVQAGTDAAKVTIIPNCSDLDLFMPGPADPALAARYGVRNCFVVGYAGSMGEANDVEVLVRAADLLRDERDIRFLLIGQGKQGGELQTRVQAMGLDNIVFAGSMPRREVADVLRIAGVCLVLFKNLPVLATNSPNKLFDALATGRPVIVNSNGWTRALVEQGRAGRYAEPGSPESLAEQIRWLRDHPAEAAAMGKAARQLAESDFDRRQCAMEFERVLAHAAARRTGPMAPLTAQATAYAPERATAAPLDAEPEAMPLSH